MKNVSAADGVLVYQKFFSDLLRLETEVVVWQLSDTDGNRKVYRTVLTGFKTEQGRLHFQSKDGVAFDFKDEVRFCWAEKDGVIFKTRAIREQSDGLSMEIPEKLCFLDGPEVQAFKNATEHTQNTSTWKVKRLPNPRSEKDRGIFEEGLSAMALSDEEKYFSNKREAPRVRAKGDKKIIVAAERNLTQAFEYALYDLSRGGLAFLSYSLDSFKKGDLVHVLEIEKKRLDLPLVGEVMSVRKLDEEEAWKIGVKFVEEI